MFSRRQPHETLLQTYQPWLLEVNDLGVALRLAKSSELAYRTAQLRDRAAEVAARETTLEALSAESFALVREVAHRELGERPYDEQILAGIALFQGNLLEMGTGEGKTLAAVAPVVLHALAGKGVHVLTYNDYLARRDAHWMEPVYRRLGLTVAAIQEGMSPSERRRAYDCDITYLTVKEVGFDLLRDSLCLRKEDQVLRPFHLALVDEADSILIDEATVPLVIAGTVDEPMTDLPSLAEIVRDLSFGVDYRKDEEGFNVYLTETGTRRAEAALDCGNLYSTENTRLQAALRNALHAEALLHKDVDYIVRDGRAELVDELTGRVAENRHWPDGLQAALEAKEGLSLQPEGVVLGSITLQHLLQKYPHLCGMTATAMPASEELGSVYDLTVFPIPRHQPSRRIDLPDLVFQDLATKRKEVIAEIQRVHSTGRPILVGTVSVEESESLAQELQQNGLCCRVLNAKNDLEEAEIMAEAGALGALTISTNMAGRGTDIRLGGSREDSREEVVALEGLYVLGTNRHASRRIDDQLRGRAGRQGDPGTSRFFLSLEDELLQRCGIGEVLFTKLASSTGSSSETSLNHPMVQKEIEYAQRVVEGQHGDIRRRLLGHAALLEGQRCEIQGWRQEILETRTTGSLLAEKSAQRWKSLLPLQGEANLLEIEQRIALLNIDRFWGEHLAHMEEVRDEIHLAALGGKDPMTEFLLTATTAFGTLRSRIETSIVETFENIEITAKGVDWEKEGLRAPSSTWTYLIHDNIFTNNIFRNLANRFSLRLWFDLILQPLLLVWTLAASWKRWRQRGS